MTGQPASRAVQRGRERRDRDVHRTGPGTAVEALPGHQQERLALGLGQERQTPGQPRDGEAVGRGGGDALGERRVLREAPLQVDAPARGAALVGDDPPRRAEQPGEGVDGTSSSRRQATVNVSATASWASVGSSTLRSAYRITAAWFARKICSNCRCRS